MVKKANNYGESCCQGNVSADSFVSLNGLDKEIKKRDLLLHSCCGPCSTSVIERLAPEYNITVFYYNPCITDKAEYEKRKDNQIKFVEAFNEKNNQSINFIEGEYEPDEFYKLTTGYSNEPEGGARCNICFRMRLEKTAMTAKHIGISLFTTTLTVSPHKNYPLISAIAIAAADKFDVEFLDLDFKKRAGFQRSIELSREYKLYRQDYCGCEFSKRK